MRHVLELEAWSPPGLQLDQDYGKRFQEQVWDAGVNDNAFIGLSQIPDQYETDRLNDLLASGEADTKEFQTFCQEHKLDANQNPDFCACKFLEYKMGIPIAWIHLDINTPQQSKQNLEQIIHILKSKNFYIKNPENDHKVSGFQDVLTYFQQNTSTYSK